MSNNHEDTKGTKRKYRRLNWSYSAAGGKPVGKHRDVLFKQLQELNRLGLRYRYSRRARELRKILNLPQLHHEVYCD